MRHQGFPVDLLACARAQGGTARCTDLPNAVCLDRTSLLRWLPPAPCPRCCRRLFCAGWRAGGRKGSGGPLRHQPTGLWSNGPHSVVVDRGQRSTGAACRGWLTHSVCPCLLPPRALRVQPRPNGRSRVSRRPVLRGCTCVQMSEALQPLLGSGTAGAKATGGDSADGSSFLGMGRWSAGRNNSSGPAGAAPGLRRGVCAGWGGGGGGGSCTRGGMATDKGLGLVGCCLGA